MVFHVCVSVTDPQMLNVWIDDAKKESVKIREKYTTLLKARGVMMSCHQILCVCTVMIAA